MKILLAVDGSEHSAAAVEAVATRPWPPGTAVRVLSAVERVVPPAAEVWYDAGGSLEQARQELTKRADQLTAGVAETLRASGLTVETAVRDGDPRSVIVDAAEEWGADLIVVGSHRPTMATYLLGSNASTIVRHARCSVLVVRA